MSSWKSVSWPTNRCSDDPLKISRKTYSFKSRCYRNYFVLIDHVKWLRPVRHPSCPLTLCFYAPGACSSLTRMAWWSTWASTTCQSVGAWRRLCVWWRRSSLWRRTERSARPAGRQSRPQWVSLGRLQVHTAEFSCFITVLKEDCAGRTK